MENKTNIVKAILAVMQEVKNIDKNMEVGSGQNKYNGVADKDVKNIVGGSMAKHGLVALPISVEPTTKVERWEEDQTWNGQTTRKVKQSVFTEVKTRYLLMHESGESIEIEGIGHGVDPQDKAAGKATTYALKNALLYSFLVPTGHIDDTDATHSDDIPTPQKSAGTQTAAKQSAPSNAPWANDNEVNSAIDRINKGEQGVLESILSTHKLSKANRAKIESAISNYKPTVDKPEVKPGTPEWEKCKSWLLAHRSEAHKLVINYRFDDADYDKLLADVDREIESKSLDALEAIDAIKAAPDQPSLNKIFNECTALHTNKAFVDAYAARQKELAKLGKAA